MVPGFRAAIPLADMTENRLAEKVPGLVRKTLCDAV
jgi:hypothetical protein